MRFCPFGNAKRQRPWVQMKGARIQSAAKIGGACDHGLQFFAWHKSDFIVLIVMVQFFDIGFAIVQISGAMIGLMAVVIGVMFG